MSTSGAYIKVVVRDAKAAGRADGMAAGAAAGAVVGKEALKQQVIAYIDGKIAKATLTEKPALIALKADIVAGEHEKVVVPVAPK